MPAPDHGIDAGAADARHGWIAAAALAYLLFVVYGSLIPFAFTDRPLDEVLGAIMPPRWIPLAATDRADWIANGLLYAPLAFLALEASCAGERGARAFGRALAVVASLALLAVAVEFAQGFFPPRTVSLNDLVAEGAGILAGAAAWLVAGPRFRALAAGMRGDRFIARQALALAVVLGYVVLALFPFDFVVSIGEVRARLAGSSTGLLFAPSACTRAVACAGRVAIEVVAGAAFGVAWHWLRAEPRVRTVGSALGLAFAWSAGIELAQLLVVSGVAQGASLLARAAGIAAGLLAAARLPHAVDRLRQWPRLSSALVGAWLAYLLMLVATTGLAGGRIVSAADAWARLADVRLIPFYYHYYVSEQWALVSAVVQVVMYAPVGALAALARLAPASGMPRTGRAAALVAGALALLVEVGKLFAGRRPDPTDLLLAMASSYAAYRAVGHFVVDRPSPEAVAQAGPPAAAPGFAPPVSFGPLTIAGAVLLLGVTLALLRYPLDAAVLAVALAAYGAALLRWPNAWLLVLPAVLPVLDLAPWTGWLFLDEFDLFAMVTVAAVSVVAPRAAPARFPAGLKLLLAIAFALALLALVRGLLPLHAVSPDMLWTLQHPTNALRPARAMLWAVLLLALVARWSDGPDRDVLQFARGMTLGLIGAGLVVVWERTAFAGFADFGWGYRAVGAFSAASTAGAQLESFVAAAMPFALLLALRSNGRWRAAAIAALALGVYAVAATVSRTAWLGAVVGVIVFANGVAAGKRFGSAGPRPAGGALAALVLGGFVLAGVVAVVVSGRLASVGSDVGARVAHWKYVAAMAGSDATGALLGQGFGTFPQAYFWNGPIERRPAYFSYRRDNAQSFVRVAPGAGTFLDQVVAAPVGAQLTLRARIRSAAAGSAVTFALCEKWILYSRDCRQVTMRTSRAGAWEPQEAALPSPGGGTASGILRPTVRFAVAGGSVTAPVDVTDLALVDDSGRNLLANGNFAAGGTHWFLTADDHWAWNIFNVFVEILFEQGWLGLLVFAGVLAYALTLLLARACRGDAPAAAGAGALLGFLVPACFDSVVDDPRMRLLLWLLVAVPLLLPGRAGTAREGR